VVQRTVHEFYAIQKELPATERLYEVFKGNIPCYRSEESLRYILKDPGIMWRNMVNNGKLVIET
jgi:hypothetical protein